MFPDYLNDIRACDPSEFLPNSCWDDNYWNPNCETYLRRFDGWT